ncbi:MAG: FmdB family zinc ribbon protein [Xanthobacteraceae bacterium]
MPVYDYLCVRCGPFTEMRPMIESDLPHACPECGQEAPRAFLTAPYFATMSAERRLAHATNERSASAPRTLSGSAHGNGCGCCSARGLRSSAQRRAGTSRAGGKSFPKRRPWMLSH